MQAAATAPAAPSPAATFDADVAAVLPPREAFGQASTLEVSHGEAVGTGYSNPSMGIRLFC